jgi:hypothetical protein
MVLEDGGGAVVTLGGDVVRWRWAAVQDAVVALGGGGGRRTCNDGVGIGVVETYGLLVPRWCQRWLGWQERTRPM